MVALLCLYLGLPCMLISGLLLLNNFYSRKKKNFEWNKSTSGGMNETGINLLLASMGTLWKKTIKNNWRKKEGDVAGQWAKRRQMEAKDGGFPCLRGWRQWYEPRQRKKKGQKCKKRRGPKKEWCFMSVKNYQFAIYLECNLQIHKSKKLWQKTRKEIVPAWKDFFFFFRILSLSSTHAKSKSSGIYIFCKSPWKKLAILGNFVLFRFPHQQNPGVPYLFRWHFQNNFSQVMKM